MGTRPASRLAAILIALSVAFLWSTSWVLIKFGLRNIPALTFAGLRYGLATVFLVPAVAIAARRSRIVPPPRRSWPALVVVGGGTLLVQLGRGGNGPARPVSAE